ncbi:Mu-like prophage major head subunit gpT family protein [Rhodanobacter denitrificans]|uniref:Mu-like prophage major head subunit gpT n=1 Tax=Rhodanobacter denitrificans TaxID=666685 RepID=M4NJR3_9GAMM|nr:Mu-like prophage major head subunit gpT family protein [Rhodanobacter denitrificans]AGG89923.1 Mu-like prophage major head subunit gpT [Rhodanobacter denitrificans]UJM85319.1 Mu-like prophage major head subunit gpT family protein [Rhodanobacter denitrificans]
MIINAGNLKTLFVAFKAAFQAGLGMAESQYKRICTIVPSTTGSEEYGWLGSFPGMREWLGDRVINGVKSHGYTIKNKPFELTVGVPRAAIEDDQYGVFTPMQQELGRATEAHPDELAFGLLKAGISTPCYDGQYFFDTDHPVIGADGAVASQSNYDSAGGGSTWYLLDTSRALRPLIFQNRKAPNFVSLTAETDENVFSRAEYLYGVDCRRNVGYGFWQMAYASNQPITEDNIVAAYTAMTERTGDNGRPLGLKPNLLVVRPGSKFAAAKIVNASTLANGAENVMKGIVEVLDTPWII